MKADRKRGRGEAGGQSRMGSQPRQGWYPGRMLAKPGS